MAAAFSAAHSMPCILGRPRRLLKRRMSVLRATGEIVMTSACAPLYRRNAAEIRKIGNIERRIGCRLMNAAKRRLRHCLWRWRVFFIVDEP